MKIAFITTEYPPNVYGGLGVYSRELTTRLVKLGHEVHVFSMNPGGLPTTSLDEGVYVHRLKFVNATSALRILVNDELRSWGPGFRYLNDVFTYNVASAFEILREVEESGVTFDIISVHDWLSAIAGLIVKDEMSNVALAFHVHSTEKGRNFGGGSPTVSALELACAEKADLIITVSYAMRDQDLAPQGFPMSKVRVVWNGVDPEKFSPLRVTREEVEEVKVKHAIKDGPLILFIGRLVKVKGVDKLIEAMPYVLKDYPNARLLVIGQGDLYDYLIHLANRLNVMGHVTFINRFLNDEEKVAYYAACDVAVFPSLYEPFGIVALEAMSMERPVVVGARGCSGLREVVIPSGANQCGIHVNPYDPKDIAWGIDAVLSSQDRGRWMGVNGRKRVLENFTWDHATLRTLKVYEEIVRKCS
ncbi:MAG: glycosyltransferase family 4 protein [Candidatus Nezhaarchaeales archaeon]